MSKEHFKSIPLFENQSANVDRENGVIRNIVIVQEGVDKDNGNFTKEFLQELLDAGQAQTQGLKSRFGHPNMCKTTLGTFIGRYKDFSIIEEEGKSKLIANLYLDEITKKTQVEGQGISYFDYLMDMSENNSDMFGNSIHFSCDVTFEEIGEGEEKQYVETYHSLKGFIASDLVDSPCATDNLFKSSEDLGIQVTAFLDANPQIFGLIKEKPELLQNFMKRYENYNKEKSKKSNIKMKLNNFLKSILGGKFKDVDVTLADGQVVTVVTDAENPQVGDKVIDENGSSLADGEYKLPDGETSYEIEGGVISEIKSEKDDAEDVTEESTEENKEENLKEFKSLLTDFRKEMKESLGTLANEIVEVKKSHATLAKSVKSKSADVPPAEETGKRKVAESYNSENVKEFRNNRKK